MKPKNLKWFTSRVGKRIFRDADDCTCSTCKEIVKKGLVIRDKDHARYMYDIQNDFGAEGSELNYRDEK